MDEFEKKYGLIPPTLRSLKDDIPFAIELFEKGMTSKALKNWLESYNSDLGLRDSMHRIIPRFVVQRYLMDLPKEWNLSFNNFGVTVEEGKPICIVRREGKWKAYFRTSYSFDGNRLKFKFPAKAISLKPEVLIAKTLPIEWSLTFEPYCYCKMAAWLDMHLFQSFCKDTTEKTTSKQ